VKKNILFDVYMSSKFGIALYKASEFVYNLRHHLEFKNYKIMNFQVLWHWTSISFVTRMKKRLAEPVARFEKEEITLVGKMTFVWKMFSSKLCSEIDYLDGSVVDFSQYWQTIRDNIPNIVYGCCRPHDFQFNVHYIRSSRCPAVRATDSY